METSTKPVDSNTASRVSLIAGILPYIWIFVPVGSFLFGLTIPFYLIVGLSLIAVIAGIVSLVQIKKSGETGKGYAICGILLGAAFPFLLFLLFRLSQ